jgi:hypothetical protein
VSYYWWLAMDGTLSVRQSARGTKRSSCGGRGYAASACSDLATTATRWRHSAMVRWRKWPARCSEARVGAAPKMEKREGAVRERRLGRGLSHGATRGLGAPAGDTGPSAEVMGR